MGSASSNEGFIVTGKCSHEPRLYAVVGPHRISILRGLQVELTLIRYHCDPSPKDALVHTSLLAPSSLPGIWTLLKRDSATTGVALPKPSSSKGSSGSFSVPFTVWAVAACHNMVLSQSDQSTHFSDTTRQQGRTSGRRCQEKRGHGVIRRQVPARLQYSTLTRKSPLAGAVCPDTAGSTLKSATLPLPASISVPTMLRTMCFRNPLPRMP